MIIVNFIRDPEVGIFARVKRPGDFREKLTAEREKKGEAAAKQAKESESDDGSE